MNAAAVVTTEFTSLPALIDRASKALAGARSAAEVLDARDIASVAYDAAKKAARLSKAKGAADALIVAAHRAQADALEIEAGAKRRLADEYDAAQQRGEIAKGRPRKTLDGLQTFQATISDIQGLTHDQVRDARAVRNAEVANPGIIRRTLDDALNSGVEPNKARLRRAIAEALPNNDLDEDDGISPDMIDAASAANRRRVFMRCAGDSIRKAEQGAGLRDALGPEIDREVLKTLNNVIKAWTDLRAELKQRR